MLSDPPDKLDVRLSWSCFRRHHQAVAKRCHTIRRSRCHPSPRQPTGGNATPPAEFAAPKREMSDAQWTKVAPLLPPQKPVTGRPAHDHRRIISAILWVQRTNKPWRALPKEFGSWQTTYSRYSRWRRSGLWEQISQVLRQKDDQPHDLSP
jgi:transposase